MMQRLGMILLTVLTLIASVRVNRPVSVRSLTFNDPHNVAYVATVATDDVTWFATCPRPGTGIVDFQSPDVVAETHFLQLAINGDAGEYGTVGPPRGLHYCYGRRWGNMDYDLPTVYLNMDGSVTINDPPERLHHATSAKKVLLADGEIVEGLNADVRHPRTFLGVSADGETVWLVVVDGRQAHSIGFTEVEGAALMRSLGAWDAVNLDGGGSSMMVYDGAVVNKPANPGGPRAVPVIIGLRR